MSGHWPPSPIYDTDAWCQCQCEWKNAHWGDYRVLKRCLVKRWEEITKLETCLHSLWTKRKNLQGTLAESEAQLACIERSLPVIATTIDNLNSDIEKAENCYREIQREREGEVDNILAAARRSSGQGAPPTSPCACRRFNASLTAPDFSRQNLRSFIPNAGSFKTHADEVRRKIEMMRAEVQCKRTEKHNLETRRDHLKNVIEQVTRNIVNVGEECENINTKWKTFKSEVEKMETQMTEQWGRSALDRLTPANVSRCRFF